jgi:hypothetical protein
MKKISNILSRHKELKILMDGKNCDKKKYLETQLTGIFFTNHCCQYLKSFSNRYTFTNTGTLFRFCSTYHSIFLKSIPVTF